MTEPPATNHPVEAEDQEEATTPASPDVPAEALGAGIADRVAVSTGTWVQRRAST